MQQHNGTPAGSPSPDSTARALEEYLAAAEAGTAPPREEFLAIHPGLADDLDACLAALRFIGRAAEEPGAVAGGIADVQPPEQAPGQLGDYRILREVGRGGMGVVYEAEQVSLGRRVALKVLPFAATMDPRQLQRFHNEARAAASLDHPHIVAVHAVGCERGVHYYAMRFIEGQTLAALISDLRRAGGRPAAPEAQPTTPHTPGRPEPAADTAPRAASSTGRGPRDRAHFRRVAEWGIQAAEALDHAHQLGIVHRDVKPANLLVDGRGGLWVTDFGLAHVQSDARLTMTGDLVGTLRYMSPEQALAKRVVIDHRTDVYSLGATLYELLTLEPAFGGNDRQELLRQIAFEEPAPPRRRNRAVPAELETIVLKALEKGPAERYATAQELADDLRRWLDDRPILARRPSWVRLVAKWVRRHRAATVAVFCFILAMASAAIAVASFDLYTVAQKAYEGAQSAHELAVLKKQRSAEGDSHRHFLKGLDEERAKQWEDARVDIEKALEILDREPGADAGERHRMEEALAGVLREQTTQAGSRDWNARMDSFGGYQARVRVCEMSPAEVYKISFTEGSRDADRAVILRAAPAGLAQFRMSAEDSPADAARRLEVFRPYAEPGQLERVAGDCFQVLLAWAEAEAPPGAGDAAGARRALHLLDLAAALGQAHRLPTPRVYHLHRARYLALAGDPAAAAAERQRIAAGEAKAVPDLFLGGLESYRHGEIAPAAAACARVLHKEPNHFWALYLQGLCHVRTHAWEAAKGDFTACLSQRPDFFWARLLRATAESQVAEFKAAEDDFAQVLRRAEEPAARWVARTNRGAMWVQRERWDDAIADFRDAIALRPDVPESYIDLAEACRRRKDWKGAVAALDQALARHPPDVAGLYHTRAAADLDGEDFAAARHDLEQAIAHAPPGAPSERLASDCVELGHLQHKAKEYEAALASCDQALQTSPDYPPAYLQRAETLLALGRNEDAGRALDRFLLKRTPTAKVYRVRGRIRAELRQYPEAVDAYSRSLALEQDAATLAYRGWAYLRQNAFRPALADFDAALRLDPVQTDALCGRGYAQARLGRVAEAVKDAQAAVRRGRPTALLLYDAACIYAVAVGALQARAGGRWDLGGPATDYQERAVALLRAALEAVPPAKRKDFWRTNVQGAADLVPVRGSTSFLELARGYPR